MNINKNTSKATISFRTKALASAAIMLAVGAVCVGCSVNIEESQPTLPVNTTSASAETSAEITTDAISENAPENTTSAAPTEANAAQPTETTKHSVTNGYDIANYPAYYDYLSTHYNDTYYADYSYSLYDINNDGTPELLTFFDADKQSIHEIRDTELNSYVRSNMSASSYLFEDGTVLATQGDPPYVNCTLLRPLSNGQSDRFDCLTFRGNLNVENGIFAITEYEGVESEVYRYIPTESERYGSDSFIQSELGIQTPSEDMKITLNEANEVIAQYRQLSVETDKISNVVG